MECITNNDLLIARNLKFHWIDLLRMEQKCETCVICKDGFGDDSPANTVYEKELETLVRVRAWRQGCNWADQMSSGIGKEQSRSQGSSQL